MRIFFIFFLISFASFAQRPTESFGGSAGGSSPFGGGAFGGFNTNQANDNTQPIKTKNKSKTKASTGPVQSIVPDSLRSKDSQLSNNVEYKAKDSTILDVEKQVLLLYGNAEVVYGDINLNADFIRLDWSKNEIFAHGMPDTSKVHPIKGKPVFSQNGDNYDTDTIRYNFKSKKAIISNIVTQQGEGYLHGNKVKKDPQENLYLTDAKYSTCNLETPHFHIAAKKIKLVNRQQIISGPFNFVLSGVPLPIGLPFGFFPIPKKKDIGTSGIIMPTYGEEPNSRGFYLRDGGYYWAVSENIGAKFTGQIYSKGSFGVGTQSSYAKRYRYGGNLNMQINYNKMTDEAQRQATKELGGTIWQRDFSLNWSHTPQSRRPDRSFSASVNLVSNNFNKNNRSLTETGYTQNNFGSSVQYTRNFGKLIRTNVSLRHDQNVSSKVLNVSANYGVGLNQFNPFVKEKNMTGSQWYEQFRIGLDISGGVSASNDLSYQKRSTTYTDYNLYAYNENSKDPTKYDPIEQKPLTTEELRQQSLGNYTNSTVLAIKSLSDLNTMLSSGQFRTTYSIPITLPMIKLGNFINFTPSIAYRGDIYTKKFSYQYLHSKNAVGRREENGVFNAYSLSFSGSMNTRFFGTYNINGKRIKAIRHTVMPSLTIGYTPDLTNVFYQTVQINSVSGSQLVTSKYAGELRNLPRFLGSTGGSIGASGNVGFYLTQTLEAKVRAKSDTAAKEEEKISLIDNMSIGTSYNLLASKQSNGFLPIQALSPITFGASSTLFKKLVNVNVSGSLDPYAYEKDIANPINLAGRTTNRIEFKGLSNISFFNVSVGTSLSPEGFGKGKTKQLNQNAQNDPAREAQLKFINANPEMYVDFDIPWKISMNYNMGYNKQGLAKAQVVQALTFNGDFSLTPKWKFGFNSGYDFVYKAPTLTTINVHRELHCWDMAFNWTPIAGNNQRVSNYSFDLRARASILQELKLSRRRSYYDRGGF